MIVSLTRSNPNGEIGFMFSPERLNVLLSRARQGLILIGNSETFRGSRKGGEMWDNFLDILAENNLIQDGLPVKCEQHPDKQQLLKQPSHFDELCPDGGCSALWYDKVHFRIPERLTDIPQWCKTFVWNPRLPTTMPQPCRSFKDEVSSNYDRSMPQRP